MNHDLISTDDGDGCSPYPPRRKYMAMRLDAEKAADKKIAINWTLPDVKQSFAVQVQNSVLVYTKGRTLAQADANVSMPQSVLGAVVLGATTADKEIEAGRVKIDGNKEVLNEMLGLPIRFDPMFNIVLP